MEEEDRVNFCIDTETYNGIIKRIDSKTADVLSFIGLINNIPISELTAA